MFRCCFVRLEPTLALVDALADEDTRAKLDLRVTIFANYKWSTGTGEVASETIKKSFDGLNRCKKRSNTFALFAEVAVKLQVL